MDASAVCQATAFVVREIAASAVELVAACAVEWACAAVSAAEMSAVVNPAAGLTLAAMELKSAGMMQ